MENQAQVKTVKDEAKDRAFQEIRNLAMGEAYLAVKDLLTQKQFAERVGIDAGKLSIVIAKLENQASK